MKIEIEYISIFVTLGAQIHLTVIPPPLEKPLQPLAAIAQAMTVGDGGGKTSSVYTNIYT